MTKQKDAPRLGENKMGTMGVGKLLVNMAMPIIIAMLVQALYNVVDSYFVSKIDTYDGYTDEKVIRESAIAAMSLAFAIQNILIGFATGIGVGVNALLSKCLGQGDQERANQTAGNGVVLALLATGLFMLFGGFFADDYFRMMSDSPLTREFGTQYIAICCIFSLGIFVEVLGERLLQSSGRTVYTMITQGTGAIINIILDPVLIFGLGPIPKMGIAGAAIATVIGQWVAALLAVIFNLKFNPDVHFSPRCFKLRLDIVKPILTVGVPAIVMNSIGSVMNMGINKVLQGFRQYGEVPVNVFGIYFKLQSFFFMPLFGLNNATISIVAYNYGACRPKRIIKTLKLASISALSFMLLGLAVFQLLPDLLLSIFDTSPDFLHLGRNALRIISWCFPFAAVCISLGASFQALGNGIYSTIVSLCRQMVVLLPAAYLLSLSGNVNLVWWAFPIAELMSLAATSFFFIRIYRQKIRPMIQ
ncbi:MAG: MATE family efflux transporter [Oscillospiraceae bacterium]|nr:MATE family efflux transporter [Oscillospiraceae bacterium]